MLTFHAPDRWKWCKAYLEVQVAGYSLALVCRQRLSQEQSRLSAISALPLSVISASFTMPANSWKHLLPMRPLRIWTSRQPHIHTASRSSRRRTGVQRVARRDHRAVHPGPSAGLRVHGIVPCCGLFGRRFGRVCGWAGVKVEVEP